jgi:L-lactate dehydrogenase complex protein LldE
LTEIHSQKPRVGLFVTCLVDLYRPSVGFAAAKLLEAAGCVVEVPAYQTCCGQPAYNSGDRADTKAIARRTIPLFESFDYVVVPSGSCGGMIKEHYPALFEDEPAWAQRAKRLAARTWELMAFLHDVLDVRRVSARYDGIVTYHDSCSGLRELGVKHQPRELLRSVDGLRLAELPDAEVCCGFGGTFCIKYPEISDKMVDAKAQDILRTGADTLLAGDMGCLLNMAGKLKRLRLEASPAAPVRAIRVRHVAEVLAGMTDESPIGESS